MWAGWEPWRTICASDWKHVRDKAEYEHQHGIGNGGRIERYRGRSGGGIVHISEKMGINIRQAEASDQNPSRETSNNFLGESTELKAGLAPFGYAQTR